MWLLGHVAGLIWEHCQVIRRTSRFSERCPITDTYVEHTVASKGAYDRALKVIPGGFSRNVFFYSPYPIFAKKAKGSRIYSVDGAGYIDYCFNYGVLILGHNPPPVLEAVKDRLEGDGITTPSAPIEEEAELAERIVKRVPSVDLVRFTPSGAEAVMHALRLARAYTKRKKIAKFEGAYHGYHDSVYISVHPALETSGSLSEPRSVPETGGILPEVVQNTVVLPFNQIDSTERIVKTHKNELAAVIMEPVLFAGGAIPPKLDFLRAVREITEQYDIPLIFDEVVTGFRLAPGGAQEYYNVMPEITIMGKVIGGGFPIGAFGGRKEILGALAGDNGRKPLVSHSGTFNAAPISLFGGIATLDALTPAAYEHLHGVGEALRSGLSNALSEAGVRAQVTGIESIFHIHFHENPVVDSRDAGAANRDALDLFNIALLNRGIHLAPLHASVLSTATTDNDVQRSVEVSKKAISEIKPRLREIAPQLTIR